MSDAAGFVRGNAGRNRRSDGKRSMVVFDGIIKEDAKWTEFMDRLKALAADFRLTIYEVGPVKIKKRSR